MIYGEVTVTMQEGAVACSVIASRPSDGEYAMILRLTL